MADVDFTDKERAIKEKKLSIAEMQKEIADMDDKGSDSYAKKELAIEKAQNELKKSEDVLNLDKEIAGLKADLEKEEEVEAKKTLKEKIADIKKKKDEYIERYEKTIGKKIDSALDTFLGENEMMSEIGGKLFESNAEFSKFRESIVVRTSSGDVTITANKGEVTVSNKDINKIFNDASQVAEFLRLNEGMTKEQLAQVYTINNVVGRIVKTGDISDDILKKFNTTYKKFENDKFDPFSDEYTGKETDVFIELLVSAMGDKDLLFENVTDLMDDVEENVEEIAERMKESRMMAKRVHGYQQSKLRENIGSRMKIGTSHRKLYDDGKGDIIRSILK